MPKRGWRRASSTASWNPSRVVMRLALVMIPFSCPSMIPWLIGEERPKSSALTTNFFMQWENFCDLHRVWCGAFEHVVGGPGKRDGFAGRFAHILPDSPDENVPLA